MTATNHDPAFELVASEPGTGVSVVDERGRVLYVNDETLRIFFEGKKTRSEVEGCTLAEIGFDAQWIEERLALIRSAIHDGRERLLRTVWEGHQQFSWFRGIAARDEGDAEEGPGQALCVTRRIPAGRESEHLLEHEMGVVESDVIDLGPLDVLSPRELEVLSLIGQGLSTKRIAEIMHRSVKTVGNHRLSLGHKLHKSNRVELALIAREAGLRVEDAARRRVTQADSEAGSG